MKTPQLLLTLSPSGTLQAELPGPNGSRQILPFTGEPADIIAAMRRILVAQASGEFKIGSAGRPTAHQLNHELNHAFHAEGCPFCNLGLSHADSFCSAKGKPTKQASKKRKTSTQFSEAYLGDIDLTEFGI